MSVINITSSFTSANSALNEVNRALTLNFSNLFTITVNHNQSIRIGAIGIFMVRSLIINMKNPKKQELVKKTAQIEKRMKRN